MRIVMECRKIQYIPKKKKTEAHYEYTFESLVGKFILSDTDLDISYRLKDRIDLDINIDRSQKTLDEM